MAEKPFFITTPIYYINGKPSIGHAYTQFAADARARFERLRGRRVYFLTGTDENAAKVARVAQEQGRDPQEFCDELAQSFRDVWDAMNISYDDFLRTTEPRHKIVVQRVFEKLWNENHLRIGSYSGWYSVPDETFFRPEETVERDGARYIATPSEDQSKAPLEWVEEKSHFFKLSESSEYLLKLYDEKPEMLQPETRRNETLSFIRQGLFDTSISRVQDWGIPVPQSVPEHENHVVYVWFPDALLNYVTAPGFLSDDAEKRAFFDECWPPDLQLMAKDIFTRFHATLWPALLNALGLEQPKLLFGHGFWTVNGRKMSKRDPDTIVEPVTFANQIAERAGCDFNTAVDALRYYALREVTFGSDGDFSREGCCQRYNSDLANGLGNLVNRALSMLKQYFGSEIPDAAPNAALLATLKEKTPLVERAYEALEFNEALKLIIEGLGQSNVAIEEQKPWAQVKAGDKESVASLLRGLLAVCQWCSVTIRPVMPHVAARLQSLLGIEKELGWSDATNFELLPAGHRCSEPKPLFPRIQNTSFPSSQIMNENNTENTTTSETTKQSSTQETATQSTESGPEVAVPAGKPTIEYDDFAKVELRAAKVLEAERVPKADKLLRLQVDLGNEKRQILAGIAQQFEPEALVGKTVVVVANLAPRKLRGFESQGMILAASEGDGPPLGLLTVDAEVPPGSSIK
jgi:methionyl-tRNA synthetase